jgi:hypothetical protein
MHPDKSKATARKEQINLIEPINLGEPFNFSEPMQQGEFDAEVFILRLISVGLRWKQARRLVMEVANNGSSMASVQT